MNKVPLTEREMQELYDDIINCNSAENLENIKSKILKYGCTNIIAAYNGKYHLLTHIILKIFKYVEITKYHLMLIDFAIEKTENIDEFNGYDSQSSLSRIISYYISENSVEKREIYSIIAKKLIDAGAKIGNTNIAGVSVKLFDISIMIYNLLKKENEQLHKCTSILDKKINKMQNEFDDKIEEMQNEFYEKMAKNKHNMMTIYNPKNRNSDMCEKNTLNSTNSEIKELGVIKDYNFIANFDDDVLIITAKNDQNLDEYECYISDNDKSNVMSTSDVFTPEKLSPSDIFGMFDEKIEHSINFSNYGPQIIFHTVHPVKSLCADITLNFKEKKCDIVGKMQKQIEMLIAKNEKLEKELCDIKQKITINDAIAV